MLFFLLFIVFIIELLNIVVEKLVDYVSIDMYEFIGKVKDIGLVVVFISLIMVVIIWGIILF